MSKYTSELRYLIENKYDIGLQEYPIFSEDYRATLNKKIIDHFYFREIGSETAELFKFYLNRTMSEIMPYYNKLYNSELLKFNVFDNVNYTELMKQSNVFAGTSDSSGNNSHYNVADNISHNTTDGTATTTENGKTKSVLSDTPQGLLAIGNIENEIYATNATIANSENNGKTVDASESHGDGKTTDNLTGKSDSLTKNNSQQDNNQNRTVTGKNSGENYSDMLLKFRETFLNIDMDIINELDGCFMQIY